MTNQQDTRPTMEPRPRGVVDAERRRAAAGWAYAISTALDERMTGGGVYAQVSHAEFRRHICRLLAHYMDALEVSQ